MPRGKQPAVSVVIPTYNRLAYVQEAIASCFDGNDGIDVEVIVVDDGSTDGTRKWLRELADSRVNAIFQEHAGPQVARNRGLAAARGNYVKFLDDDDWLESGSLISEAGRMASRGAHLGAGDIMVQWRGRSAQRLEGPGEPDPFVSLSDGTATSNPLRFMLSAALARSLRWQEAQAIKQDVLFFLRAAASGDPFVRFDWVVGHVRDHGGRRVSGLASGAMPGALAHLDVLLRVARESGRWMGSERRLALQRGIWSWIHLNHLRHPREAERAWAVLTELLPERRFLPPRRAAALRWLDRMTGPMNSERIIRPVRFIKNGMVGLVSRKAW